jgi:hypothetical protein
MSVLCDCFEDVGFLNEAYRTAQRIARFDEPRFWRVEVPEVAEVPEVLKVPSSLRCLVRLRRTEGQTEKIIVWQKRDCTLTNDDSSTFSHSN